jgi:hypothetical protein
MSTISASSKFALAILAAGQAERTAARSRRKAMHEVKRGHIQLEHAERVIQEEAERRARELECINAGVSCATQAVDVSQKLKSMKANDNAQETKATPAEGENKLSFRRIAERYPQRSEPMDAETAKKPLLARIVDTYSEEPSTGAADDATEEKGFLKKWGQAFETAGTESLENYGRNVETELEDAPEMQRLAREKAEAMEAVIEAEADAVESHLDLRAKVWELTTGSDGKDQE